MKLTTANIGECYYPIDNSYSQDLTTGEYPTVNENKSGLAGNRYTPGLLTKLVYGPFNLSVSTGLGQRVKEFCIVEYNGRHFMVLNNFSTEQPQPFDISENYLL